MTDLRKTTGSETRTNLRLVLLEDTESDAILIVRTLEKAGFHFTHIRVETEADFRLALKNHPDLILADFVLPNFDALHALRIVKAEAPGIPVIVVTGYLSEERAKEFVVFGAEAYISKDKLDDLPAIVRLILDNRDDNREHNRGEHRKG